MSQFPKYDRASRGFNRLAGRLAKGLGKSLRAAARSAHQRQRARRSYGAGLMYGECGSCGIKINFRRSSIGTVKRCPACGAKNIIRHPSAIVGCVSSLIKLSFGFVVVGGLITVVVIAYKSAPPQPISPAHNDGTPDRVTTSGQTKPPALEPELVTADPVSPEPSARTAKYVAVFSAGKPREIADYLDEGDSYVIFSLTGGHGRYPKSMIAEFKAIPIEGLERSDQSPDLMENESTAEVREWTDAAGSHQTRARFMGLQDGKVVLRKVNGGKVLLAIKQLSDKDQKYVRQIVSEQ